MTINNQTGHILTAANVYVEWNHDTGHKGGDHSLHLRQIVLDTSLWNGDILAPSAYIPGYFPSLPQGESIIRFRFNQSYDVKDGTERIIVTLSNPGCINYPVDSSH